MAWTVPPVFGLGFLLYIEVLTPSQLTGILTTPLEPIFILGWLAFAIWYFREHISPICSYLDSGSADQAPRALAVMESFPSHFWILFLLYLLMAPASVILAAEGYTNFVATPVDWFRIHLVALIVSIIVGLPIFFAVLDLFGQSLNGSSLQHPHITLKAKVFLIGALIPLLIDTMLVQYYWTRTGYFSFETFTIWLVLELLAVAGSLMFMRSLGRSLAPLYGLSVEAEPGLMLRRLYPVSTDEVGVLVSQHRELLQDLQLQQEVLQLRNAILRGAGGVGTTLEGAIEALLGLAVRSVEAEAVYLLVTEPGGPHLECLAYSQRGQVVHRDQDINPAVRRIAVDGLQQDQDIVVDNIHEQTAFDRALLDSQGIGAFLAIPLHVENSIDGVLVATHSRRRHYRRRDVQLLRGLVQESASLIHSHRLQRNLDLVRSEGESQIRLLLDSTSEGIYGVDREGKCIFVNQACVEMLGYTNEAELLGKNLHAMIHHTLPDGSHYPKELCRVRMATQKGENSHCDIEVHWRKDGSSFPVEYWSRPIRRHGEVIGTVVTFIDISERRQAEAELRLSKERYALAQKAAGIGSWEWDIASNQVYWSENVESMFGLKPGTFTGSYDDYLRYIYPEDGPLLQQALEKALAGSDEFSVEHRIVWPDASLRWLSGAGKVHRNTNGEPQRMFGVVQDITERHLADEVLRQSEARLAEAQRIAHLGDWWLDLASGDSTWSEECYRILGCDPAEPAHLELFMRRVHPADRPMLEAEIARAAKRTDGDSEREHRIEHRVIHPSGAIRQVIERGFVEFDADGVAKWLHGTVLDITDIRRAEAALAATEAQLHSLITHAPLIIVACDALGIITLLEGHGLEAMGLLPGEQVGGSVFDLYRDNPEVLADMQRVLGGEAFTSYRELNRRVYEVSYTPIESDTGGNGALCVAVDDTERYRAEQELELHRQHLEQLVAARTHELQTINQELEAFSYSVSHDLRAPLRSIDGFTQALMEDYHDLFDQEALAYLDRVRKATNRMATLIDDLLQLSRLSRREVKPKKVNLSALAEEIATDLNRDQQRAVAIDVEPGMEVMADEGLLRIALENILGNAWKFTGRTAAPRVTVGVQRSANEEVFFIRDNGVGFDMRNVDKLFGPFQRLHRVEDFEGTGIGLATVKRIVNRHAGRVWIEGEPDHGVTLWFTLSPQGQAMAKAAALQGVVVGEVRQRGRI